MSLPLEIYRNADYFLHVFLTFLLLSVKGAIEMLTSFPKTSSTSLLPSINKANNLTPTSYGLNTGSPAPDSIAAPDLESLIVPIVIQICETTGWDYGEIWLPTGDSTDDETVLELSSVGHIAPDVDDLLSLEQFQLCSEGCVVSPGEGLPGRVWSSGRSEWLADATAASESYWSRHQLARAFDIGTGFATPVMVSDRVKTTFSGRIQAVLVFFKLTARD
jgi:hypothetical protein